MTTMPFFAHMGLIFVPLGSKAKYEGDAHAGHGGSAWVSIDWVYFHMEIFLKNNLNIYLGSGYYRRPWAECATQS